MTSYYFNKIADMLAQSISRRAPNQVTLSQTLPSLASLFAAETSQLECTATCRGRILREFQTTRRGTPHRALELLGKGH